MEPDLSQDFNYGIVPPPDLDWEAPRLRRPAWQPNPAQARAARLQLAFIVAILALFACVLLVLAVGWRF